MRVSVNISEEDVEFLDRYAAEHAFPPRSAVLRQAIRLLRLSELGDAYSEAWSEWDAGEGVAAWDATSGDGT